MSKEDKNGSKITIDQAMKNLSEAILADLVSQKPEFFVKFVNSKGSDSQIAISIAASLGRIANVLERLVPKPGQPSILTPV